MSLLRALQRQGILTDLSASSSGPQPLTDELPSTSTHDNDALPTSPSPRRTLSSIFRRDNLTVGTRVIIAADADLRGEISVGSGTVIHPKATILALQGAISIGSNCIIEETAVIVNRSSTPIKIGDHNLFEVGCRIEASSVGSYNVFEVRSRVAHNVRVGSHSVIGAGCTVLPRPISDAQLAGVFDDNDGNDHDGEENAEIEGYSVPDDAKLVESAEPAESARRPARPQDAEVFEELPDQTVVFGADSKRRLWSGEGAQQQAALHAKHLEYLRDIIPRTHKLKIIQGVRAPPLSTAPTNAPTT